MAKKTAEEILTDLLVDHAPKGAGRKQVRAFAVEMARVSMQQKPTARSVRAIMDKYPDIGKPRKAKRRDGEPRSSRLSS